MDPAFQTDIEKKSNPTTSNQRGFANSKPTEQESGFEKLLDMCFKVLEVQYKITMPSTSSFDRSEIKKIVINIPGELYQTTIENIQAVEEAEQVIPEVKELENKEEKSKKNNTENLSGEMPLQEIPLGKVAANKSKRAVNDSIPVARAKKKATKLKKE